MEDGEKGQIDGIQCKNWLKTAWTVTRGAEGARG